VNEYKEIIAFEPRGPLSDNSHLLPSSQTQRQLSQRLQHVGSAEAKISFTMIGCITNTKDTSIFFPTVVAHKPLPSFIFLSRTNAYWFSVFMIRLVGWVSGRHDTSIWALFYPPACPPPHDSPNS